MDGRIVIDGNSVYEIDEACLIKKKKEQKTVSQKPIEKGENEAPKKSESL
ncbi:hypothetical protein ABXS75_11555 [Roseburia hominis]